MSLDPHADPIAIFARLAELHGSEQAPYLAPLNLRWTERGRAHDLAAFEALAAELSAGGLWDTLLLDRDWRCHLIAATCLMAASSDEAGPPLQRAFLGGSFVSPQLAVALAVHHRDLAREAFEQVLGGGSPKAIGAALVLMPRVGMRTVDLSTPNVDLVELRTGMSVARTHEDFWRSWSSEQERRAFEHAARTSPDAPPRYRCMTKAVAREPGPPTYGPHWITARRAVFRVYDDHVRCGDWVIRSSDVWDAVLYTARVAFVIRAPVLVVSSTRGTWQFGFNPWAHPERHLPFDVREEPLRMRYSWFSVIVRVLALAWLLSWATQRAC